MCVRVYVYVCVCVCVCTMTIILYSEGGQTNQPHKCVRGYAPPGCLGICSSRENSFLKFRCSEVASAAPVRWKIKSAVENKFCGVRDPKLSPRLYATLHNDKLYASGQHTTCTHNDTATCTVRQ